MTNPEGKKGGMSSERDARDWASGLPPEVICRFAQRLPITDYLRLRAVCSSWASALAGSRLVPTPSAHFPWLGLLPNNRDVAPSFLVRCPALGPADVLRPYNIPLIPQYYKWIGSGHGWLVFKHFFDHDDISLLNPITASHLHLPSLSTLPPPCRHVYIRKVVLDSSLAAVIMYGLLPRLQLAFSRPGDESWTALPLPASHLEIVDIVHHHGRLVAAFRRGKFHAFDLSRRDAASPTPMPAIPECPMEYITYRGNIYLVSAPSGDLFKVLEKIHGFPCLKAATIDLNTDDNSWTIEVKDMVSDRSFIVMKLSPEADSCSSWVEVDDLGETSLFLDRYSSASLSAGDVRGLRRNCVYFAATGFQWAGDRGVGVHVNDVGVFDMGTGVVEQFIPRAFRSTGGRNQIAPIWFMPSLL